MNNKESQIKILFWNIKVKIHLSKQITKKLMRFSKRKVEKAT